MNVVICSAEIAGLALANRISTLGAEVVLLKSGGCLGRSERIGALPPRLDAIRGGPHSADSTSDQFQ